MCEICNRRRAREYRRRRRKDVAESLWLRARDRATQSGASFNITAADVRRVYPKDGRCPVLGIRLERATGGKAQDASPSLDRLNAAWGYEAGNIAVISQRANRAKNSLTAAELEKVAAWMRSKGLN